MKIGESPNGMGAAFEAAVVKLRVGSSPTSLTTCLILDHKNGVYNDNRLENLRIVCPNCNATLDTHCGKHNRKRNIKIKELGLKESVDFRNVLTKEKEMSYIKRRKVERSTFENLKEDVDKNGYCSVGRKYNVTDNTIRKWLKFYEKNNTTNGSALA